jgi:hypothetical protein
MPDFEYSAQADPSGPVNLGWENTPAGLSGFTEREIGPF